MPYPLVDIRSLRDILSSRFDEYGFMTLKDLPLPSSFKDMDKATARILDAIKNRQKITIIGDYDVDGVTATTIMSLFFQEIDYPVSYIIPNRFTDGYGLSANIIPRIKGTDLAITVDNGISAVYASQLCKDEGIELIITDHHLLPPTLPQAYAIIDQKQIDCDFPYSDVCGAQIAWYLIASIKNALGININMMSYMELASIAIIADMMPLKHINRAMVLSGIKALNKSQRPAIRAFLEYSKKDTLDAEDIGFFLAPMLNSAGRMEDASFAVDFLTSTNIYDARVRLERLADFNTQRKATEQEITDKAMAQANSEDDVIIVYGKEWHEGVVGIVSARVARAFEKPCIVLSLNDEGILKGSGRSFGECDLFAIASDAREYLDKFGGHQAAIGLSMCHTQFDDFNAQIQENYKKANYKINPIDPDIVGEIKLQDISFDLTKLMQQYQPYGQENPTPKFISYNVEIIQIDTMGKEAEHLRFIFGQNGTMIKGVKFKTKERFAVGDRVKIIYTINENHFRGDVSLQLMVDKVELE